MSNYIISDGGFMIIETRWKPGELIFAGFLLEITLFFLVYFLYDASIIDRNKIRLIFSILVFIFSIITIGTTKVFKIRPNISKRFTLYFLSFVLPYIALYVFHWHIIDFNEFINSPSFLSDTFLALSSGIFEETIFRGFMFTGMLGLFDYFDLKHKILIASIFSSILFSSTHLWNLLYADNYLYVILQLLDTFLFALIMVCIRITTNGILLCILLHFISDWVPGVSTSPTASANVGYGLNVFLLSYVLIIITSIIYLVYFDKKIIYDSKDSSR